jgi:chemotaxis protein MotB
MGFTKKQPPPEEQPGAPEWMLTFSDCVTLLLTFFVLLMTFSSLGESEIKAVSKVANKLLPGFDWTNKMYNDSLVKYLQSQPPDEIEAGSEKPTLEKITSGGLKATASGPDFDYIKVFSMPSKKVFYGTGLVVSAGGRSLMATVASFLEKVPNRAVICEHGGERNKDSNEMGLQRAWAVMEYLAEKHGLNKERFSISGSGANIATEDRFESNRSDRQGMGNERVLEIMVLDRSSYN